MTAFDPTLGITRLRRQQIDRLVSLLDPPTGPPANRRLDADLYALGAIGPSGPHAVLRPPLAVLRAGVIRVSVRQWRGDTFRTVELVVGRSGIVALVAGGEPDVVEVRHHPRADALARLLAGLVDLRPGEADAGLPSGELAWDDVLAIAADPPQWLADRIGEGSGAVHDIRWQRMGSDDSPVSALVLADLGVGGWAQVVPESSTGHGDLRRCRLQARGSEEIWFGLCRLVQRAVGVDRPRIDN